MYIGFSTCDAEGQFEPGFALEVKHFNIHGFAAMDTAGATGLWFDITHMDGEKERLLMSSSEGWRTMLTVGQRERIANVYIVEGFPPVMPITKAEFRQRIGIGKIYDPKVGHYKDHLSEVTPPTFKDWKEFALKQGYDSRVIDFLEKDPTQLTLGTPRGWSTVAQILGADMQDEALHAFIRGALFNKDTAEKFVQFLVIGQ